MRTARVVGFVLLLGVLTSVEPAAQAADMPAPEQAAMEQTPPRLSLSDGQVSFWRPGAEDWATAQVNTPLAAGDEIYTASPGTVEVQIGPRAFVRAWANTQLGLANQEPDFLQFKVTMGSATFDLRALDAGHTVEVDTPNAAFTIEHAGYYRVDVSGARTSFITRRGGRATLTPSSGEAVVIAASEEVIVEGTASPRVTSYVAPKLDAWDQWNYARTGHLLDAVSARYVSPGTYGASDLDPYGTWRAVPTYGAVWVPTAVPTGWVPYSTGSWMMDPVYGWTWVDTAPWGWAPYHYGRWVFVDGFWAWAPGPVVARPLYAPALVAFFGGPSMRIGISTGGPFVGWVALGWGEPVVPWWGRPGFVHQPSWRGWGGPRVVNNVVINNTTVVNVQNITVYRNASVQNAVVAVHEVRFGRGPIATARETRVDVQGLQLIQTVPQVTATPASFVPTASRGVRPPEESVKRSVVATRTPRPLPVAAGGTERTGGTAGGTAGVPTPAPRIVPAPHEREGALVPARPPFAQSGVERRSADRDLPPSPPRAPAVRPASPQPRREPPVAAATPAAPQPLPPGRAASPQPQVRRPEAPQVAAPAPAPPAPAAPQQPLPGRAATPPQPARRPEAPQVAAPTAATPAPAVPQPPPGRAATPQPPARRPETPQVAAPRPTAPVHAAPQAPPGRAATPPSRPLPGEPANRLSPNRVETQPSSR